MDEREPPGSPPDLHPLFEGGALGESLSRDDLLNRAKIETAAARTVQHRRANMDTLWPTVPIDDRRTIERIAKDEGVTKDTDAFKQFAAEWLAQLKFILEIAAHFDLQFLQQFPAHQPNCFIALTERGSLLTGTPPKRGWHFWKKSSRHIEYIRIPARKGEWRGATSFNTNYKDIADRRKSTLNQW